MACSPRCDNTDRYIARRYTTFLTCTSSNICTLKPPAITSGLHIYCKHARPIPTTFSEVYISSIRCLTVLYLTVPTTDGADQSLVEGLAKHIG